MKKYYKPTYGFTFFLQFSYMTILMIIGIIPMLLHVGVNEPWYEILGVVFLFIIIYFIIFLIINLISKCFTKYNVSIDATAIYYNSFVIEFERIYSINFDCGEFGKRTNIPNSIVIIGKNHGYINIERPSIMLVFKLMVKCRGRFKINNIKRLLFLWPTLAFVLGFPLYYMISCQE